MDISFLTATMDRHTSDGIRDHRRALEARFPLRTPPNRWHISPLPNGMRTVQLKSGIRRRQDKTNDEMIRMFGGASDGRTFRQSSSCLSGNSGSPFYSEQFLPKLSARALGAWLAGIGSWWLPGGTRIQSGWEADQGDWCSGLSDGILGASELLSLSSRRWIRFVALQRLHDRKQFSVLHEFFRFAHRLALWLEF